MLALKTRLRLVERLNVFNSRIYRFSRINEDKWIGRGTRGKIANYKCKLLPASVYLLFCLPRVKSYFQRAMFTRSEVINSLEACRDFCTHRRVGPRRNIELALWIRYQEKETEVPVEPAGVRTVFYCGVIEPTETRRKWSQIVNGTGSSRGTSHDATVECLTCFSINLTDLTILGYRVSNMQSPLIYHLFQINEILTYMLDNV